MAFLATGPCVIDQEHDEQVWAKLYVQLFKIFKLLIF